MAFANGIIQASTDRVELFVVLKVVSTHRVLVGKGDKMFQRTPSLCKALLVVPSHEAEVQVFCAGLLSIKILHSKLWAEVAT